MNTLEKFIDVVGDTYGECTLYGLYQGRGYHTGVAIKCDSEHDYLKLCLELAENGLEDLAEVNTHKDNLGLGRVYSWDLRHFGMTEKEATEILNQYDFEDEDEEEW